MLRPVQDTYLSGSTMEGANSPPYRVIYEVLTSLGMLAKQGTAVNRCRLSNIFVVTTACLIHPNCSPLSSTLPPCLRLLPDCRHSYYHPNHVFPPCLPFLLFLTHISFIVLPLCFRFSSFLSFPSFSSLTLCLPFSPFLSHPSFHAIPLLPSHTSFSFLPVLSVLTGCLFFLSISIFSNYLPLSIFHTLHSLVHLLFPPHLSAFLTLPSYDRSSTLSLYTSTVFFSLLRQLN